MTTIIVVEPHPLLRLGILQLLNDISPDTTARGEDYACLAGDASADGNCDLVVLSISAFEELQRLASEADRVFAPETMLLLSDTNDMPHTVQGLPRSVAGYVAKDAAPQVLLASIRLVLAGGTCFPMRPASHNAPPALSKFQPIKWPPRPDAPAHGARAEHEMLGITPRQYEVLVLLARGYPMKTVGRCLNISVATAKAHTETLYQRLDVHNRNAAVYEAVSRGATLGWPKISGPGPRQIEA